MCMEDKFAYDIQILQYMREYFTILYYIGF